MRKRGKDGVAAGRLFDETDAKGGGTLGEAALDARARAAARDALRQGTARIVPLDDKTELLVEPVMAKPRLVLVGGGHVGLAIAKLRAQPAHDVTAIADPPAVTDLERLPGATELASL